MINVHGQCINYNIRRWYLVWRPLPLLFEKKSLFLKQRWRSPSVTGVTTLRQRRQMPPHFFVRHSRGLTTLRLFTNASLLFCLFTALPLKSWVLVGFESHLVIFFFSFQEFLHRAESINKLLLSRDSLPVMGVSSGLGTRRVGVWYRD